MKKNFMAAAAPLLIISAGIMWGSAGFFVRSLSSMGLDSVSITAARALVSSLILGAVLFIFRRDQLRIKLRDLWIFIGSGMVSFAMMNVFYNIAIVRLSVSLAAVLMCSAPFFVVVFSRFIFNEKITGIKVLALILAFTGCILVSDVINNHGVISPEGLLCGCLSAVVYSLYSIFSRTAVSRGYAPMTINFWSFFLGFAGCAAFADWSSVAAAFASHPVEAPAVFLLNALIIGVFPYFCFTEGLRYMETGKASILASVETVAATVFGMIIYHEMPSVPAWIGIFTGISAVVLLSLKR